MTTLAEVYPVEQARCRGLLGEYKAIGDEGAFGAMMLENLLARADVAVASGDVVAMLQSYEEMKAAK